MSNFNQILSNSTSLSRDVTHITAKHDPIHNWYPYLEGFSEKFIENIVSSINPAPKLIYEPFSGSGTIPIYCKKNNIDCIYSEVNPFLIELTKLKLHVFTLNSIERSEISSQINKISADITYLLSKVDVDLQLKESYNSVFGKSLYFNEFNFNHILKFSSYIKSIKSPIISDIIRVAVTCSLLPCSLLKRSGDVRFRKGKELENIPVITKYVSNLLLQISLDINNISHFNDTAFNYNHNAKTLMPKFGGKVDAIVTSPPYLNGTNYIRNTKLELWFTSFLLVKSDLSKYRKEVVTSGINDVSKIQKKMIIPIIQNILDNESLWYDKRIPKMINDYFFDMSIVIKNFHSYLKPNGYVFLDIGDSIYANQHIPTDLILLEIFKETGFTIVDNLKLRSRRSKNGTLVKQCLLILKK
jgi:DNA modification methylase